LYIIYFFLCTEIKKDALLNVLGAASQQTREDDISVLETNRRQFDDLKVYYTTLNFLNLRDAITTLPCLYTATSSALPLKKKSDQNTGIMLTHTS
jgi:hypothetical protein